MGAPVLRTVLIGASAGLLASFAMEEAQTALHKQRGKSGEPDSGPGKPATEEAADEVAIEMTGAPVPSDDEAQAGRAVHYATGATLGVIYALLAERYRGATRGFGLVYGLVVSLILDEAIVPALKLSPPPDETPWPIHRDASIAHGAFGLALEATRGTLDLLLPFGRHPSSRSRADNSRHPPGLSTSRGL